MILTSNDGYGENFRALGSNSGGYVPSYYRIWEKAEHCRHDLAIRDEHFKDMSGLERENCTIKENMYLTAAGDIICLYPMAISDISDLKPE